MKKKELKQIERLLDKYILPEKREFERKELKEELKSTIYEYAPFLVESRLEDLSEAIIKLLEKNH